MDKPASAAAAAVPQGQAAHPRQYRLRQVGHVEPGSIRERHREILRRVAHDGQPRAARVARRGRPGAHRRSRQLRRGPARPRASARNPQHRRRDPRARAMPIAPRSSRWSACAPWRARGGLRRRAAQRALLFGDRALRERPAGAAGGPLRVAQARARLPQGRLQPHHAVRLSDPRWRRCRKPSTCCAPSCRTSARASSWP
jgi:hypothetical protein